MNLKTLKYKGGRVLVATVLLPASLFGLMRLWTDAISGYACSRFNSDPPAVTKVKKGGLESVGMGRTN